MKYTAAEFLDLMDGLDSQLFELLNGLTDEQWKMPTVASKWCVKDVAAHLLDGNLRGLSTSRDGYFGDPPGAIDSYQSLIDYLNKLNMSWTQATKRLSPKLLISLLQMSGPEYINHLRQLDPHDPAIFSVGWAGEETSTNHFHIAREYSEKFLHQQQIRDALGNEELLSEKYFHPFLEVFMKALPHTFRNTEAERGSIVSVIVSGHGGGQWSIIKEDHLWVELHEEPSQPAAAFIIERTAAWKLFSKSWRKEKAQDSVEIKGEERLGNQVYEMVAVMA